MNSLNEKTNQFSDMIEIKGYADEISQWLTSPNYILENGFLTKGIQKGKKLEDDELDDLGDD